MTTRILRLLRGGLLLETREEQLARESIELMTETAEQRRRRDDFDAAQRLAASSPFSHYTCLQVLNILGTEARALQALTFAARAAMDPITTAQQIHAGRLPLDLEAIASPTREEK